MGEDASVASAKSQRSSASSVRSQRSQRSERSERSQQSERSQRSTSSSKSNRSTSSSKSNRSTSSSKGSKSLEDGLERIAKKYAATNGNGPASVQSQRSSASSAQRSTSSRQSSSSKKSVSLNAKLERIAEKSDGSSSVSSWRSPYQSSSTASTSASVASQRSSASKSTRASSSSKSTGTSKSSSTVPASNVRFSALGQQAEALDYLEAGNNAQAIVLFTQAVEAYLWREGGDEKESRQALATLYGYRCEALYEIGAYEASVRDARSALECERLSRPSVGDHPYSSSSRSASSAVLHPEKGAVLRAKVLCSLGHSLLRGGDLEGAADALDQSINAAKKALDDAEDLTVGERKSSNAERAVNLVNDTMKKAAEGLSSLGKYETLTTSLETGSYKKDYLDVLDCALEIAPAAIAWHVTKVNYLIGRHRWFAVANHCEQVAAKAANWDGIFSADLADIDPFPGIPPVQELNPDFFAKDSTGDEGIPVHLRVLCPKATRDAVFRLPRELLPSYLRALRLEERYKAAVLVGTALAEFDAQEKDIGNDNYAENKRFNSEWDKLDRIIKVKEEGDSLFRDAYYDRAVTLYGEGLTIDGDDGSSRNRSILRQASSWPVACTKANEAGGKLHAVLHSNRAACFSAMGRHEDAITESSHAIHIHSMYTKAILRRARCYAKIGQDERARADFNRFIILVEGAREYPYPPPNQGSACHFDMPSGVSEQQLGAVKSEMNELGIQPIETKRKKQNKMQKSTATSGRSNNWFKSLCCKKSVKSQVVTQPSHWPTGDDQPRSRGSSERLAKGRRKVSFSSMQANQDPSIPSRRPSPTLIKSRPAFDHPLDPPTAIDTNIDYYSTLGLTQSASDSDIKQAYHKLARVYHPDRNSSTEAQDQFQEIHLAYAILGDVKGKKKEYDKAMSRMLDP